MQLTEKVNQHAVNFNFAVEKHDVFSQAQINVEAVVNSKSFNLKLQYVPSHKNELYLNSEHDSSATNAFFTAIGIEADEFKTGFNLPNDPLDALMPQLCAAAQAALNHTLAKGSA